jgi:hypothetical protein
MRPADHEREEPRPAHRQHAQRAGAGLFVLMGAEFRSSPTRTAITEAGRLELEANRDTVREFYEQGDASWETYADELSDFTRRLLGLAKTIRRAARHGRLNRAAVRELGKILDETVARVEKVFEGARSAQ